MRYVSAGGPNRCDGPKYVLPRLVLQALGVDRRALGAERAELAQVVADAAARRAVVSASAAAP